MMVARLTLDDVRDLEFQDLVERVEVLLGAYDKPQIETGTQKLARIEQTLEEMPAVYRWLRQCQSWADHWAQAAEDMGGRDLHYKRWRQRRDFFDNMASAASKRYDGASRLITLETSFDPSGMPTTRRGN